MNTNIKNYLGMAIIGSLVIAAILAIWAVNICSKSVEPGSYRSFSVSGEGKVVAIPDIAKFTFSVITEGGKNLGDLQKTNTDKVNKAIEFVKATGVESKDIKTQNYSVSPRYQYFNCSSDGRVCPPAQIVGYTVSQTVEVKARDFTKIGDLLSGVVKSEANSVSELNFTIDDPTSLQNEARAQAIEKAKEKAKSIARAGDFSLGKILSINESGYYPPVPYYDSYRKEGVGLGASIAPSAPIVEPGSQEVVVNIDLVYEID